MLSSVQCNFSIRKSFVPKISRSISTHDGIGPLSGIRILDLTRIVAGPFCTMLLGDLGADIIKIEQPGTGDETRKFGPPFFPNSSETCYFMSLNRNKRSICVNLKANEGQQIIYDFAKVSDVLVENFVPGKLNSLNLGYEKLREVSPRLIYCSISGFGPVGPYTNKPGFDTIAASMGGLFHITGPKDGEPCKVGIATTDIATGMYAHGAIMAALLKRLRTGKGQKVDCDLFSTQLSMLINIGSNYLNAGIEGKKWGTAHESIVPYESFPTRDGFFSVGAVSDAQFTDFCNRLQMPELLNSHKYKTNALRVANRGELITILRETFAKKSTAEWLRIFEGSKCAHAQVNTIGQAFNDHHVKKIGIVKEVNHPTVGKVKLVGPAVTFSDGGNDVRLPPPKLGQHTVEILRDILTYDTDKIYNLKAHGIVE